MPVTTHIAQIAQIMAISTSLIAAGGIASLSFFDVPLLQAQPADRSLPSIRWLFSRGSHIFPQASVISAAGFAYLVYDSLPGNGQSLTQILQTTHGVAATLYFAAVLFAFSIGPYTHIAMIPNNFALIKMNEESGAARSANAAKDLKTLGLKPGQRSAEDSVAGKGEGNEFTDSSGPQEKAIHTSTPEEDEAARQMLENFKQQNLVRAGLMATGGILGLAAALST